MSSCGPAQRFPSKHHLEEVILNFNFAYALMEAGEPVVLIKPIQVILLAGEDPNPGATIDGPPALTEDGSTVQFPMVGGIAGNTYDYFVTVVLQSGLEVTLQGYVPVI